jgi:hypothetical protein
MLPDDHKFRTVRALTHEILVLIIMLAIRMTPDTVMRKVVRPVKMTPVVVVRTKHHATTAVHRTYGQQGYDEIPEFHMFLLKAIGPAGYL